MTLRRTTRADIDVLCPPTGGVRAGGLDRAELRDYGSDGYVWRADGYGDHRVSRDGTVVESVERGVWKRFLLAQVLPLAALLQGLEVLHAGAVRLEGGALLVTGPSGAGKSTLVAALVEEGAGFLTDDVAALEHAGDAVHVHPGPRLGGGPHPVPASPVDVLAVLRPVPGHRPIRVEVLRPDPRLLLGATFIPVIREPHRLERLLDLCSRLAASARLLMLDVPRGADPHAATARLQRGLR